MSQSIIPSRETIDVLPITSLVCPRCSQRAPAVLGPGTANNYARLLSCCCQAFITWAKWPRDQDGRRLPRPLALEPHNHIKDTP